MSGREQVGKNILKKAEKGNFYFGKLIILCRKNKNAKIFLAIDPQI